MHVSTSHLRMFSGMFNNTAVPVLASRTSVDFEGDVIEDDGGGEGGVLPISLYNSKVDGWK